MRPSERFANELASVIKTERKKQQLDQAELALVAGVGARTVWKIENRPEAVQLDVLLQVLQALGIRLRVEVSD